MECKNCEDTKIKFDELFKQHQELKIAAKILYDEAQRMQENLDENVDICNQALASVGEE